LEERIGYFGRRTSAADVIDEFQGGALDSGIGSATEAT
jgi:hypothetical protein